MSIIAEAKKYGQMVASNRGVLPQLGLAVVRAAAAGDIDPDDAREIYLEYYKAARRGITKVVESDERGLKQNVSKLRQLIKLGQRRGALTLLQRAERLYDEEEARTDVVPLYPFMVQVARAQLASPQPLSDHALTQLAKKNAGPSKMAGRKVPERLLLPSSSLEEQAR